MNGNLRTWMHESFIKNRLIFGLEGTVCMLTCYKILKEHWHKQLVQCTVLIASMHNIFFNNCVHFMKVYTYVCEFV